MKIPSPTKRNSDSFLNDKSRRTLFESGGDGTSTSFVGNTIKTLVDKPAKPRFKNYLDLEWTLIYAEEDGVLLLIFAKPEGQGKLQVGKTCTYGMVPYEMYG